MQASFVPFPALDLAARAERTLEIFHRWGYAPRLEELAASLLGGPVRPEDLTTALDASGPLALEEGFVFLRGHEHLVRKSRMRLASYSRFNGAVLAIAREFVADLVRICPFVDSIAISGSVASGGFDPRDDIDFDLFVRTGTKYITYLLSILLGIKYSLRYRRGSVEQLDRTPIFPKVICINVVWPEDQTRPFSRQDENLAFELMRCVPTYGSRRFQEVLAANGWLRGFFPQLLERAWNDDVIRKPGRFAGLLESLSRRPGVLHLMERFCRGVAFCLYGFVQWTRRKNPSARARIAFLRDVKRPYEVFQD